MTAGILHPSVIAWFVRFSQPLEGLTKNPYLDVKGLLTIGIGCLIDPPDVAAKTLQWVFTDGTPAPAAEVLAQLKALKAQPGLAKYPWNSVAVLTATTVRLTDQGVLDLATDRLNAAVAWLVKYFPAFAGWPADAQMCAVSMAWAVGAGWPPIFGNAERSLQANPPRFMEAIIHAPDPLHPGLYLPAEIDISTTGNPGIVPRNAQNELLLSNAQLVLDNHLDVTVLHWPKSPLNDGTLAMPS